MSAVLLLFILEGLFAVLATVNTLLTVGQLEAVWKLLLNGGDATRVLAFDDAVNLFWKIQLSLFYTDAILNIVDGHVWL